MMNCRHRHFKLLHPHDAFIKELQPCLKVKLAIFLIHYVFLFSKG